MTRLRTIVPSMLVTMLLACATAVLGYPQGLRRTGSAATTVAPEPAPRDRITFQKGQEPLIALPGPASRRIRSLLRVPDRMAYGSAVWHDAPGGSDRIWVLIDLKRQILSVFDGGDEIGSAVILYGMKDKPTPLGAFAVLEKAVHHRSSLYQADMPYMLRLTGDGVAIHASRVRRAAATHGCIGVPPEFARRLFSRMRVGDRIYVLQQTHLATDRTV